MRPLVILIPALMFALPASAQRVLEGEGAFGGWRNDKPGVARQFKPADLPAPNATRSSSNSAGAVAMPSGARPDVPAGFQAELVASGLQGPRVVRTAPNGDLFVADSAANRVLVLRLTEGSAKIARQGVFAENLNQPYGIAFFPPADPQWVYIANTDSVVRYPYTAGDLRANGEAQTIVSGLPDGGHWTRDLAFSGDGNTLYVSVGSQSNVAEGEGDPPGGLAAWQKSQPLGAAWGGEEGRAQVLAFDPDGKNRRVVATGLRNCSGLAVQPGAGSLWCVVNERDGLGDNLPFDYATSVARGAFYGWPWYYIGGQEDPRHAGRRPDLDNNVSVPDVLIQPHSAPLGITFSTGTAFPSAYRGGAFVTLHGSWNRGTRTGYKVVYLPFEDGKPTGAYQDFMTGMVISDAEVWGRPVGVAVAKDGSLIVTEDGSGTIWRVSTIGG